MDNAYINKYDEHFNVKEMTPESYRALFENSVQGIYQSTPQGKLIMVNPRLVEILGYSSMEELLKLDMAKDIYFYPDERERLTAKYLDYYQVDIKWKKKDGSPIFVRVHGRTIKDIYNKIIRYEAMVEDITEKKLLEEAKKASDESFRLIFENALEGIYKSKVDGSIVMANPAFVKMLGYKTVDEVLKLNFINDIYFDAEARKDVIKSFEASDIVRDLELVWKRKDGSPLIVRSNGKVVRDNDGEITCFEVFVEDITERKRTEYALKNSEERFRTIFENSPIGIYQCTISGALISVNNAMVKILGYDTPEELLERNLPNDIYYNQEDRERIKKELVRNGSVKNFETLWVKKNKKIINVRISGAIVKDIKGNYIRFDGLVEDITKHKMTENALAKILDFNTQLIDIAPVGIISFNKDGIINRLNKKYVEINGSNVETLKNRLGQSVFTCPILENLSLKVSIKKMLIYGKEFHIEDFLFKKHGEEFYLSAKGVPLLNINMEVEGGLLVIEDITKDVKAKKHLEYLSMHDSLTGLYNRAFFQEEMIRLSNPRFLPVTILICDLNNLKIINDTYGHFQGDKYLKDAAILLKKPFRSSDTVARVGGDEFAIILPYTGKKEADRVYKRILDEIDKYNSLNPQLPMGISIGYTTKLDEESMMIDIYREADNNMYKMKPRKKNDQHPEN